MFLSTNLHMQQLWVTSEQMQQQSAVVPEAEWHEVHDPQSGKTYFFNSKTQETSWHRPASLAPPQQAQQQQNAQPLVPQQMSYIRQQALANSYGQPGQRT